ncbi:TPA: hypothetical protein RPW15_001739 [Campylobacter fetus subsp. venerealis]|uniref:VirB3 type IV secretion protein n=2 Tax=Campylobacter TaxID=194 RepID=A0AAE6J0G6_CAMFE|nr:MULTISPECIES: hypothetical protein [Campylobacter]OCS21822.1 hypothetical protein CFVI97532_07650 [Campylobacter fetus subsp. venerealis cfvi97/532]OCS25365.1 hypothetical protein CFVB10_08785 [Campylobacter fetus subsp. venerealis cfvB10]OCS28700.1 hypothetical protein CFVCCUG33900_08995 [Campylobacter fetus subsp. venerealis LMG 6570 = CCUG 33900]OCS42021.1 hypothetical protein CFVI02298_06350 [Campylobacter fetus subsp. venerealis cfvi02/298]AHE95052.1 hypothetical protein CFVI03293_1790
MVVTDCYMDLTKKTKIMGLTTTSLLIIFVVGFVAWFILILYSLAVVAVLYCFFFVLEFFDEDIYEIIGSKMKISQNKFYA